jgi:addiction module HigA family antidote
MTSKSSTIIEDIVMIWQETHPGVILREELETRGLSASGLALKLRVAPQRIQEIVAGKRSITPETALRLGRYFGNEPEFWLSLQATHDLAILRREQGARIDAEVSAAG